MRVLGSPSPPEDAISISGLLELLNDNTTLLKLMRVVKLAVTGMVEYLTTPYHLAGIDATNLTPNLVVLVARPYRWVLGRASRLG